MPAPDEWQCVRDSFMERRPAIEVHTGAPFDSVERLGIAQRFWHCMKAVIREGKAFRAFVYDFGAGKRGRSSANTCSMYMYNVSLGRYGDLE